MSENEKGVDPNNLNVGDAYSAPLWCGKDLLSRHRNVIEKTIDYYSGKPMIVVSDSEGKTKGHIYANETSYWAHCISITNIPCMTIDPRKVKVNDFLRLKSDPSKYYTVIAVRETGVELSQQLDKPHVLAIFLHWDHVMWYDLEDGGKPEAPEDLKYDGMPEFKLAEAHAENDRLRKLVVAMAERIFAQSDLLSKKAEK